MDDFGLLVGRHLTALPTLADTELNELLLDASGRLIIAGRFLEDAAHTTGDPGLHMLAVRRDADTTLVDTDGDYAPLQVDENGRLKVVADIEIANGSEKAEDTAHTTGDIGNFILAVRQDTLASSVDTDGDYAALKVDSIGALYVRDSAVRTSVASIDTEIQSLTHVEDTAHSSGHVGMMPLAVRRDADTSLVDTDGDYAPLQVDSIGRLKTVTTLAPTGTEAYTVTDNLAAAGDGLVTITAAATPWITVASLSVGAGVTALVYGWQFSCDQNCQARIMTDDGTDEIVYKTDINSSAQPGVQEHFGSEGRIEIPGSATLELRIEVKKRSATGGNAQSSGSLHVRTL